MRRWKYTHVFVVKYFTAFVLVVWQVTNELREPDALKNRQILTCRSSETAKSLTGCEASDAVTLAAISPHADGSINEVFLPLHEFLKN